MVSARHPPITWATTWVRGKRLRISNFNFGQTFWTIVPQKIFMICVSWQSTHSLVIWCTCWSQPVVEVGGIWEFQQERGVLDFNRRGRVLDVEQECFNRIRWTEVKLWRHWPSVVQSTIADGHPAPGSTLLIAHFTTSHGNVNIKYIRLDLGTWSTLQFTRRLFFCFARFADSALEDYATRCLCHISSSQSDTAIECQQYFSK